MRVTFVLKPYAARRLIAKGVAAEPVVKKACATGRVLIAGGLTNAYVFEELTGKNLPEKWRYTSGIVTGNGLMVTDAKERVKPACIERGQLVDVPYLDFMKQMSAGDVIIKGCNAYDLEGNVGIFLASDTGGTAGAMMGLSWARGIEVVVPAGHEKLVPSVREASKLLGLGKTDLSTGYKVGMAVIAGARLVTEVSALNRLFMVKATVVGGGGCDGAEGAVVIACEGEKEQVEKLWEMVSQLNLEPPVSGVITA